MRENKAKLNQTFVSLLRKKNCRINYHEHDEHVVTVVTPFRSITFSDKNPLTLAERIERYYVLN